MAVDSKDGNNDDISDSSDWKEMTDKTSGRIFYYNTKTKKTQWVKPSNKDKSNDNGEPKTTTPTSIPTAVNDVTDEKTKDLAEKLNDSITTNIIANIC